MQRNGFARFVNAQSGILTLNTGHILELHVPGGEDHHVPVGGRGWIHLIISYVYSVLFNLHFRGPIAVPVRSWLDAKGTSCDHGYHIPTACLVALVSNKCDIKIVDTHLPGVFETAHADNRGIRHNACELELVPNRGPHVHICYVTQQRSSLGLVNKQISCRML